MNHSCFLLRLQSFFGKSQQLIFSGFDGGSPTFGFGIGYEEGPESGEDLEGTSLFKPHDPSGHK